MKSLTFFNNKGGVGKTTLACNMAFHIASDLGYSVLLVDCDPQCNATQLLLQEDQWDKIYGNRRESQRRTILKVLRNIRAGDSEIDADLEVAGSARFHIDVLAGHPSLSMVEDRLSSSWVDFQGGDLGGGRRSLWALALVESAHYDVVIFDVGPSLGALNRSVLLGSHTFVTPMSADLFSLYALDNIADWIGAWSRDYRRGYDSLKERGEFEPEEWGLAPVPYVQHAFAGYTVQQYVTKNTAGTPRNVNAYDRYRRQIPERAEGLRGLAYPSAHELDIGLVPNMFSMVPLAQAAHAPIRDLTTTDGLRGAQVHQQARYSERLKEIATRLVGNIGIGNIGIGEE